MMTKPHILGMLPCELAELSSITISEARRIIAHAVTRGADGFPLARPVAADSARRVASLVDRRRLTIVDRVRNDRDGFEKFLFRLHDGLLVESVLIPLEKENCYTICLSSQAGCAMACDFCATGRLGFARHLETWEMIAQFVQVRDAIDGTVTGAVFQGQGEPLHNFDNVLKAIAILKDPSGGCISEKRITVSTVGLVPAILRLAEKRHDFRLIVSLTSAIEEKRRRMLPAAAAWDIETLAGAMRHYQQRTGRRLTIAWVAISGFNVGLDEVAALERLFDGVPFKLNLIDVNDSRADGYRAPSADELSRFRDALRPLGMPVVRRYSGGAEKHAACGMLSNLHREAGTLTS